MNSKYKQEVELLEKQIYEFEKMSIYLELANDVLDRSNSMEGPEIIENISDMTESEKEKKKAEVTIFTAKFIHKNNCLIKRLIFNTRNDRALKSAINQMCTIN